MEAILNCLWLMSLQACLLIIVVLIARVLLKKYPKVLSYSLWALVGLRLLCPVFVESPFSLQPDYEAVSQQILETEVFYDTKISGETQKDLYENQIQDALDVEAQKAELSGQQGMHMHEISKEQPSNAGKSFAEAEELSDKKHAEGFAAVGHYEPKMIFAFIYLSGVIGFAVLYVTRYFMMWRRVRTAVKLERNVWLCDKVDSPFVIGVFCPRIILPYRLTNKEEHYIILHENTHIRHLDPLIRVVGIVCLCLHWWNPFVWLAVRFMNKDMEMFCDESVLKSAEPGERKEYAETLLSFAVRQSGFHVGLAFGESNAEQRIRNVLKGKKRSRIVLGIVVVIAAASTVLLLTIPKKNASEGQKGLPQVTPVMTQMAEREETIQTGEPTPTVALKKKQVQVFTKNEMVATNPVPDYYTLDALSEQGTVRTVKGILPGAAPGTWYIAANRGVVYYWGCYDGQSVEDAELYSYAIFNEDYPLANGIKVGMSKEEILDLYPDMACVEIKGETYEEDSAWNLGFVGVCYPHSLSGDDENLNYQGKKYWRWQEQFEECLLAEIAGETRQGRALALALMIRNDKVEAITFYCRNDGAVTPSDWTIEEAKLMEKKNAELPELSVVSNLLDTKLVAGSKEEQMLAWYQRYLYDGMQILGDKFAICDIDLDGRDEVLFYTWGPNDAVDLYHFSVGAHVQEYDPESMNRHVQISETALGFQFYENGIMVSSATHNHTFAVQDGRELWPYSVYQYNADYDTYECLTEVSAWDKFYHPDGFPADVDADGDGMVYCFTTDGSWQDGAAYKAWFMENFAGLKKYEVPYQKLTVESIEALLKN